MLFARNYTVYVQKLLSSKVELTAWQMSEDTIEEHFIIDGNTASTGWLDVQERCTWQDVQWNMWCLYGVHHL